MQQVATEIMEDAQDLRGNLHRVTLRLSLRYRTCIVTADSHDLSVGLRNIPERLQARFLQESFSWQTLSRQGAVVCQSICPGGWCESDSFSNDSSLVCPEVRRPCDKSNL